MNLNKPEGCFKPYISSDSPLIRQRILLRSLQKRQNVYEAYEGEKSDLTLFVAYVMTNVELCLNLSTFGNGFGKPVELGNCKDDFSHPSKNKLCTGEACKRHCFSTCYSVFQTTQRTNRFLDSIFLFICVPVLLLLLFAPSWCSHIYS